LHDTLTGQVKSEIRETITERILREADIDKRVGEAFDLVHDDIIGAATTLEQHVRDALDEEPDQQWVAPIHELASDIAQRAEKGTL
jgi:hypothetical protein